MLANDFRLDLLMTDFQSMYRSRYLEKAIVEARLERSPLTA
jgi:hypothetical protein